jgi:hypothetical protein
MWKPLSAGAVALSVALAPLAQAQAGPVAAPAATFERSDMTGTVTQVGWHGRGWGWGGLGIGIGAGLIAGAIIADSAYRPRPGYYYDDYAYDGPYYYPRDYRGDPRQICAQSFRSFDWRTGTYTTYNGERRLCPYLR